jgi:hypothetical protein
LGTAFGGRKQRLVQPFAAQGQQTPLQPRQRPLRGEGREEHSWPIHLDEAAGISANRPLGQLGQRRVDGGVRVGVHVQGEQRARTRRLAIGNPTARFFVQFMLYAFAKPP